MSSAVSVLLVLNEANVGGCATYLEMELFQKAARLKINKGLFGSLTEIRGMHGRISCKKINKEKSIYFRSTEQGKEEI